MTKLPSGLGIASEIGGAVGHAMVVKQVRDDASANLELAAEWKTYAQKLLEQNEELRERLQRLNQDYHETAAKLAAANVVISRLVKEGQSCGHSHPLSANPAAREQLYEQARTLSMENRAKLYGAKSTR